jgi:hypothetical protein
LSNKKKEIEKLFSTYRSSRKKIISNKVTRGKIYEAWILSKVLESLRTLEKFFIVLKNDNFYKLKSSPGSINRKYPRFDLYKSQLDYESNPEKVFAEVWTNVEFLSLSYKFHSKSRGPTPGEYHELDILITLPNIPDHHRPKFNQIYLGIECKATKYKKSFLREILGVRSELSILRNERYKTIFNYWLRKHINVTPPSCLLVYCIDEAVKNYEQAGKLHGIDFIHQIM